MSILHGKAALVLIFKHETLSEVLIRVHVHHVFFSVTFQLPYSMVRIYQTVVLAQVKATLLMITGLCNVIMFLVAWSMTGTGRGLIVPCWSTHGKAALVFIFKHVTLSEVFICVHVHRVFFSMTFQLPYRIVRITIQYG